MHTINSAHHYLQFEADWPVSRVKCNTNRQQCLASWLILSKLQDMVCGNGSLAFRRRGGQPDKVARIGLICTQLHNVDVLHRFVCRCLPADKSEKQ